MENRKPLVLISNDDGYHANGIKTLVSFLKDWCERASCGSGKCPFWICLCLFGYYSFATEATS